MVGEVGNIRGGTARASREAEVHHVNSSSAFSITVIATCVPDSHTNDSRIDQNGRR